MGYIRRNGRAYYIRSIRRGGKVTSEYVGTGKLADAVALLDRDFRALIRLRRIEIDSDRAGRIEADRAERARLRALGERLHGADRIVARQSAQMALMRDELAPAECSPIERLLAERSVLCWLHVALLEYEAVDAYAGARPDIRDIPTAREIDRRAEVIDRRLARAQSRYVQALTALAKVRRLALPAIVAQFNLAGNQQVNVASLAKGVTEP